MQAWDRRGAAIDREVAGVTAGTFAHEVDHLQGKLFLDRVTDTSTLCTWAAFAQHYEAKFRANVESVVARYGS